MEAHRALPTPECEIMKRTVFSVTAFAVALLGAASVLPAPAHAQCLIGYPPPGEDAGGSVAERAALNNAPALTIPTFSPSADIQNGAYTDPSLYVRQGLAKEHMYLSHAYAVRSAPGAAAYASLPAKESATLQVSAQVVGRDLLIGSQR